MKKSKNMPNLICKECGQIHVPKIRNTGAEALIAIVLLLLWILPGLIYIVWSCTKKYNKCESCGSKNLVSVESPLGKKLLKDLL